MKLRDIFKQGNKVKISPDRGLADFYGTITKVEETAKQMTLTIVIVTKL